MKICSAHRFIFTQLIHYKGFARELVLSHEVFRKRSISLSELPGASVPKRVLVQSFSYELTKISLIYTKMNLQAGNTFL